MLHSITLSSIDRNAIYKSLLLSEVANKHSTMRNISSLTDKRALAIKLRSDDVNSQIKATIETYGL